MKKNQPLWAYHGKQDSVLNYRKVFEWYDDLDYHQFNIIYQAESNLGHNISPLELEKMSAYFEVLLGKTSQLDFM